MDKRLIKIKECLSLEGAFDIINEEIINSIEKSLKALEIIKKKTPDIYYVLAFRKFDTYDAHTAPNCESPKLTKEEWTLLKEVLLWQEK